MSRIQENIWDNSKHGVGPCRECPNAEGEYNHPGFFNTEADILVVEESPSKNHFDLPNYDRSNDYQWYEHYFEEVNRDSIADWPPVSLFLEPVFQRFGYTKEDVSDLVFMTSAVKCPTNSLDESFDHCGSYLERELREYDPSIVITAGKMATECTAPLLGVPRGELRSMSISKEEWWGLSEFDSTIPLIHVPHWGYYNTHHQLSDEEWGRVIESVQSGLEKLGFS